MNTLSDAFDIADLLDPTHPAWELPSIRREVGRLVLDSMRGHENGAPIFVGTADAALMLGLAHGTMYQFASNARRRARVGFPAPARVPGMSKLLWKKSDLIAWAQQRIEHTGAVGNPSFRRRNHAHVPARQCSAVGSNADAG